MHRCLDLVLRSIKKCREVGKILYLNPQFKVKTETRDDTNWEFIQQKNQILH